VILINLLPHRDEKRRQRKQAFFAGLIASALVGAAVVGAWLYGLNQMTAAQRERNDYLKQEIAQLELQIKDIATLKAEIESLKARQKAVEDLQTNRNIPVFVLDELVKHTPEGVYLVSVKQTDQVINVIGVAQTNERVSELLRNTLNNAVWLEKPELVEIKVANVQTANKEQRRLYDFSMRVSIKRPSAPASAASAASAPARAASSPAKSV
jgi:type IV pilus assembly protein PilN